MAKQFPWLAPLVFGLILMAPRRAEAFDSLDLAVAAAIGGGIYVVGGTGAFLALDISQAVRSEPMPPGLAISQSFFGATLLAGGLFISVAGDLPEMGVPLSIVGGGLAAVPLVELSMRDKESAKAVAVRIAPGGLTLSGKF